MGSEGHYGEFNTDNDGFILKLRHGGILKLYETPARYVGGTIKYFYNMQIDFWGIMTLKDKVVELGYTSLETLKLFSDTTKGIVELLTDRDAWNALNESDVLNQIEVFVVNELMIETSALVETDNTSENEVKESYEDLDEFYDSEFDME
nr:uncharacterized protein LOC109154045 [Ipomoea batatas]